MSIFDKIVAGAEWLGKTIGKGLAAVPKIIRLTEDAEEAAHDALPQVITVVEDAGALAIAATKDSGKFLVALAGLSKAVAAAGADKGVNISADKTVVTAFEQLVADFDEANVSDILTAFHKLVTDAQALDSTVLVALDKMKADA